jgi:hypothetical protein
MDDSFGSPIDKHLHLLMAIHSVSAPPSVLVGQVNSGLIHHDQTTSPCCHTPHRDLAVQSGDDRVQSDFSAAGCAADIDGGVITGMGTRYS